MELTVHASHQYCLQTAGKSRSEPGTGRGLSLYLEAGWFLIRYFTSEGLGLNSFTKLPRVSGRGTAKTPGWHFSDFSS